MNKPIDVAGTANRWIWDFVHRPENRSLRPGTGSYCAPFRGGLFGEVRADRVATQLAERPVEVLWFGTNPCFPRSLENIISPDAGDGDFPSFEWQIRSGLFGSVRWTLEGDPVPSFNPIERPQRGWKVYRDMLARVADLECVAMANFLPWGSQNAHSLVDDLGRANRPLLERMFKFADDLSLEIVRILKPRLVVVPFSLGRNKKLRSVRSFWLAMQSAVEVQQHTFRLPEGSFNFHIAECRQGALAVPTVFLRHPSSLRLSTESRERVCIELASKLREIA